MTKNKHIISNQKRKMFAAKFTELANMTVAALVFGQFLSDKFNLTTMVWGLAIALSLYMASFFTYPN